MNRHSARELLFTLVFEYTFKQNEDFAELYAQALLTRELENDDYVKESFEGIITNISEIDKKIASFSNEWQLTRLSRTSLSILRVSAYEMLFRSDIPFNVSINEAVELAKKFDEGKAPKFINGLLNSMAEAEGLKD